MIRRRWPETIVPALRKSCTPPIPRCRWCACAQQQAQIDTDLADERLLVSLSSIFGVTRAGAGVGRDLRVMALSVAQRTREIGIRHGLGAILANSGDGASRASSRR